MGVAVDPVPGRRGVAVVVLAILPRGHQPADRVAGGRRDGRFVLSGPAFDRSEAIRDRSAGLAHAGHDRLGRQPKHSIAPGVAGLARRVDHWDVVFVHGDLRYGRRDRVPRSQGRSRAIRSPGDDLACVQFLDDAQLGDRVRHIRPSPGQRGQCGGRPGRYLEQMRFRRWRSPGDSRGGLSKSTPAIWWRIPMAATILAVRSRRS